MINYQIGQCFLGSVLVVSCSVGLYRVSLRDTKEQSLDDLNLASDRLLDPELKEENSDLEKVLQIIENPKAKIEVPLFIIGTEFQRQVWQALGQIPPGSTATYKEVAEKLGRPNSFRAVARACSQNQLAVVIPCHRVVGSHGNLSGYRWGVERKRMLLEREKSYGTICQ